MDKFAYIVQKNFFSKGKIPENTEKQIFFDDIKYECFKINDAFSSIFKREYKRQREINKIKETFIPFIERYNNLLKSKNKVGNIIVRTVKLIHKYIFIPLEENINKFKQIKIFSEENFFKTNINEENEIILLNIILGYKQITNLDFAFYNASILEEKSIFNVDENSDDWKNLEKIIFRVIPKEPEDFKTERLEAESNRNPDLFFSILSNVDANDSLPSIIFSGLKNFVYYKTNGNKSQIDAKKYQVSITPEKVMNFFGTLKKLKYVINKLIPNIGFRRKIYVKKELPNITRKYIEKLINFMKGESIPINSEGKNDIRGSDILKKEDLPIIYRDKLPDKNLKRNYVSVTILNKEKIYFKDEKKESFFSAFNLCKQVEQEKQINNSFRENTIIIHIHGGGFIAGNTLFHERYLRKWVNQLNIPIFGINYSIAPEYCYPEALNDVYQAYMWIIKNAKTELNMDIKHIILSGDSAGGCLILGLNNLLIVQKEYKEDLGENMLLPELVLAQYPGTYINLKNYSNSFPLCLRSQFLSANILRIMYDKYVVKYEKEDEDPFLNPSITNNYIFDRMKTKIRLFFGSSDIFRGDSIRYLDIISKYNNDINNNNKIDVRGYELMYLGHSFNGLTEDIQQIGRNVLFPEIEDFLEDIKIS